MSSATKKIAIFDHILAKISQKLSKNYTFWTKKLKILAKFGHILTKK